MTHYYLFPSSLLRFDRERPERTNNEICDSFEVRLYNWQQSGEAVECEESENRNFFLRAFFNRDKSIPWPHQFESGINVTPFVSIHGGKVVFVEPKAKSLTSVSVCPICYGNGWYFSDEWLGNLQGRKDCKCKNTTLKHKK